MNKIKCNFCKKNIEFEDGKIKKSGKAEIIVCERCSRSITIGFNGEKYYESN